MSEQPARIFIVDDEPPARLRLKALLADIADAYPNIVAGEAENGKEALEKLRDAPADVVLIDIRMPEMDGIDLAIHLRRFDPPPAIVFVTAYDQYAVKAFDLNAADYLLKPARAPRLLAALRKASHSRPLAEALLKSLAPEGRKHLASIERGRVLLVPLPDILYLKAELKYVTARTREREFLLEESLTHLEHEFALRFVRIHRNCLVAREAIAGFERAAENETEAHWLILLRGVSDKLAVSRRQWPLVKAAVAEAGRHKDRDNP